VSDDAENADMSLMVTGFYLIWSHEHGGWWAPGGCGYVRSPKNAGRFSRENALHICANAMPGTAERIRAMPDIPVREEDVRMILDRYHGEYPWVAAREWQ
jgi:hypothetical protein